MFDLKLCDCPLWKDLWSSLPLQLAGLGYSILFLRVDQQYTQGKWFLTLGGGLVKWSKVLIEKNPIMIHNLFLSIFHFSVDVSFPVYDVISWVSYHQILFKSLQYNRLNLARKSNESLRVVFTLFFRSNRLKNWRLSFRPPTPKSDAVERRAKSWKSCRLVSLDRKIISH